MNQSRLTAQWWQHFLNDIDPPSGVHFVKSAMITANDKRPRITTDLVSTYETTVIPVNNWLSIAKRPVNMRAKATMIRTAKARMDSVTYVTGIEGPPVTAEKEVRPLRVMSPFFDFKVTEDNLHEFDALQIGNIEGLGEYVGLSDGYWLFLNLQEAGKYHVKNVSSCATGVYTLNIDHELLVS